MFRGLRVAVVIPAYNEEALIGGTIRGVPAWVDHVVVVDDRSVDGTALAVRRHRSARLVAVHLAENRGVGGAILRGYAEAVELGADVVVVMAGDGQMDPDDLPRLLAPIADGVADYVKGNRLGDRALWSTMPLVRVLGNFALSALTRGVSGYWHLSDSQCGYTAIHRRMIERLADVDVYPRYGFPNDLLAHLAVFGARVEDRPVRPIYGSERSGIRLPQVAFTISGVLARAWLRRLWRTYARPVPLPDRPPASSDIRAPTAPAAPAAPLGRAVSPRARRL